MFLSLTPVLPHGTLPFFLYLTFESCFFMFSLTHPSFPMCHTSHSSYMYHPFLCVAAVLAQVEQVVAADEGEVEEEVPTLPDPTPR